MEANEASEESTYKLMLDTPQNHNITSMGGVIALIRLFTFHSHTSSTRPVCSPHREKIVQPTPASFDINMLCAGGKEEETNDRWSQKKQGKFRVVLEIY